MKVSTSEYSRLRHAAEARARRLLKAGYDPGYRAPMAATLSPSELKTEYRRLERWMNTEKNTVKGRRAAAAEATAKQEARRARERERYAEKRRAAGQEYKPRPPKSQERPLTPQEQQKRERKREYNRQYRQRRKDIETGLNELKARDFTEWNALNNLWSGLKKYGIRVRSFEELQQWGFYIKERDDDRQKQFYEFDMWLDEAQKKTGKSERDITGDDIENMMEDFEKWKSNQDEMKAEFVRPRQPNEYKSKDIGSLWAGFMATV